MRTFITLVLTVLLLTISSLHASAQEGEKGIQFFKGTWNEALAEATKLEKPIFVDAYTTWCGPCKWMAANVFTDENVGAVYNEKFINYKFDMEKGEGPAFANKYQIRAYPTLLFIDGEGKVVHREMGAKNSDLFIEVGNKALSSAGL